jgi:hypothetical protein
MATWRRAGAIMTFRKNELAAVEKALHAFLQRKRPPEHIRSKLDIGFKIIGQSIELVEIRLFFASENETTLTLKTRPVNKL